MNVFATEMNFGISMNDNNKIMIVDMNRYIRGLFADIVFNAYTYMRHN